MSASPTLYIPYIHMNMNTSFIPQFKNPSKRMKPFHYPSILFFLFFGFLLLRSVRLFQLFLFYKNIWKGWKGWKGFYQIKRKGAYMFCHRTKINHKLFHPSIFEEAGKSFERFKIIIRYQLTY